MAKKDYHLTQTGAEVQRILNGAQRVYIGLPNEVVQPDEGDICIVPAHDNVDAEAFEYRNGAWVSRADIDRALARANTAYQKPANGIPESDIADGVIPDVSQFITKMVDDLVNYYTKSQTYTKEEVQQIVSSLSTGAFIPVAELPTASADTFGLKIYLVPSAEPQAQNIKDEFITVRSGSEGAYTYSWEQIGSTAIDLSDYVTEDALATVLEDYALKSAIPTALSQLTEDSTHRLVTDTEKTAWGEKYKKPDGGIPSADIAPGVIPDVSGFITKSVNDLVNYYLKDETYTKAEVAALIGAIQQFHYEIYASTSTVTNPQGNVLYLIGPTGSGSDKYEEYVYTNNTWTKIGDTSIDLSDYVTTTALNTALADYTTTANLTTLLAGKQDVINDLAAIRSGAAAGATAYQKPQYGIPESDLDYSVTEKLRKKVQFNSLPSSDMTSVDDLDDIGLSRNDLLNLADGNASALIYNQDIEYGMSESDYAQTECIIKKASRIVGDRNNKCELIFVFSGYEYAITADYNTRVATVTVTAVQDITNKADKVSEATNGHLAALDGNGNLVDSGKSASDFAVEANPTVPSGTTPGTMETIKIGSQYYELGGGTIDAEDYSGVAPVIVNPSNYYTKAETEELVETPVAATQPSGGFLPNVIYDLGELTGSVTFALATPTDNTIANTYVWTFETGSTAPTVAWPSNLTWLGGNAPTINTGKHYEITIRKGYANCLEF